MKKSCCADQSSDKQIELVTEFLKIIAEENRLKILCILAHNEHCVCDIWQYLDIPQNLASHHLKVLKDFGLIQSRKEGLNVFYCLKGDKLAKSKKMLDEFLTKEKSSLKNSQKACCKV